MGKLREFLKDRTLLRWCLFCAVTATLLYILYFVIKNSPTIVATVMAALSSILSALSPLFIGLVIAYLLSPLVEIIDQKVMSRVFFKLPEDPIRLERRKGLRRFISILLTFLLIIALIVLILYAFGVLIIGHFVFTGIQQMAADVIDSFSSYETEIKNWAANLPQDELSERITDVLNSITGWVSESFSASAILEVLAGISGSIINLALGAIVSIYLLKDKYFFFGLWRKFLHLVLSQKKNAVVTETLHQVNSVFSQFIRGALLDALIIAILSSIGLSILGLRFAVFIGCFAGICNVIPYFGPILGMIPAFIIGTFTEGWTQGILAVVILLLIQQVDANIIYPKIVGATTGLHPLFVLLAVTVAGHYGGILGMVIAVPIAGVLQVFIVKWAKWMDAKRETSDLPS